MTERVHRWGLAGAVLGGAVLLFGIWALIHPRIEGDTILLLQGVHAGRACIAHGHWLGCAGLYSFPLFQHLPAAALSTLGVGDGDVLRVLAGLNTAAFAGILALAWWILRRRAGSGAAGIVVLALAAGPLIWYARSSFGEVLAAFLMLVFLEAVLSRRGAPAVVAATWLAGVTKETAIPFLLVIGLVALFAPGARVRTVRPQLVGMAAGAALAFASNSLFNLFRFDSIWNTYNLQSILRVPGLGRRTQIAVAIWTAPNGGLMEFWPLAVLLGIATLVWAVQRREGTVRWPAIVLLGVTAWLTAGFASWFSPFGWIAWGPRLELPWIPILLVLAVALYPCPASKVAAWVTGTTRRRLAAGLAVAAAALPHVAALQPPDPLPRLFATDRTCPQIPVIQTSPRDYFYMCTHHQEWEKKPVLLDALGGLGGRNGVVWIVLLVASSAATVVLGGRSPAKAQETGISKNEIRADPL